MGDSKSKRYEYYDSIDLGQQIIAHEVIDALNKEVVSFSGKKVLDVGCGLGHKSYVMGCAGADVYGVDPFETRVEWIIKNGILCKSNVFNCQVQDLPEEMFGSFDIITMFMYRIIPKSIETDCFELSLLLGQEINRMQLDVTKALGHLIKPDGEIIIEICYFDFDNYLHAPNRACTPIIFQFKKTFSEVTYFDCSYNNIFIRAKNVVPEAVERISFTDIDIKAIGENKPKFHTISELTKMGCYYNGRMAQLVWDISEDYETMVYSRVGTTQKERQLKLTNAEAERKLRGSWQLI